MGTFGGGERYDDNPFIYFESAEYIIQPQQKQDMPNPLRAMYEDIAPLLLRSPPSKRYPQQPTGRKEWDILTDPISELLYTSAVPDPIIGLTLQRTMRPTVEGKEGLATHLNILVDCSSSMNGGGDSGSSAVHSYGVSPQGFPLGGYHLAQIVTALMIAQAELAKDSFSVWGFASGGYAIYPKGSTGEDVSVKNEPSKDHKGAIDYFLDLVPKDQAPFRPHDLTNMKAGINKVVSDLQNYEFDQSVTVIIMDGGNCGSLVGAKGELFNKTLAYNDEDLRKMGPVFYVVLGSPYNKADMESFANNIREALTQHYKQNMEGCCLDFYLQMDEAGGLLEFGGALVQMAQVNAGLNTTLKPCPRL